MNIEEIDDEKLWKSAPKTRTEKSLRLKWSSTHDYDTFARIMFNGS